MGKNKEGHRRIDLVLYKLNLGHCPDCVADKNVFCPRDCDAECLDCGKAFCAHHIGKHLETHFIALDNNHCSKIPIIEVVN